MDSDKTIPVMMAALIGVAVGYLIGRDPVEARKLRAELARTKADSERISKLVAQRESWRSWTDRGAASVRADPDVQEQSDDPLARLLTPKDMELERELDQRRTAGEHILESERPMATKLDLMLAQKIAASRAEKNNIVYGEIFSKLGVGEEDQQKLETHLSKIQQASSLAEYAIRDLLSARDQYDKRVRSVLSDQDYAAYVDWERSKPGVREYGQLREFAEGQNLGLDPSYADQLTKLLRDTQAYSTTSWGGPYEGVPDIAVGTQNVIAALEQSISKIRQHVDRVDELMSANGMPENIKTIVDQYFASRIAAVQSSIEGVKNPGPRPDPFPYRRPSAR